MGLPQDPVTLKPEDIGALNKKLSDMRHNVNNCLALITAAAEVATRRPEMIQRVMTTLMDQPQKLALEIQQFSEEFHKALGIKKN